MYHASRRPVGGQPDLREHGRHQLAHGFGRHDDADHAPDDHHPADDDAAGHGSGHHHSLDDDRAADHKAEHQAADDLTAHHADHDDPAAHDHPATDDDPANDDAAQHAAEAHVEFIGPTDTPRHRDVACWLAARAAATVAAATRWQPGGRAATLAAERQRGIGGSR